MNLHKGQTVGVRARVYFAYETIGSMLYTSLADHSDFELLHTPVNIENREILEEMYPKKDVKSFSSKNSYKNMYRAEIIPRGAVLLGKTRKATGRYFPARDVRGVWGSIDDYEPAVLQIDRFFIVWVVCLLGDGDGYERDEVYVLEEDIIVPREAPIA